MSTEQAHLRRSPFDAEWVMYAPHRANIDSIPDLASVGQATERACPFCPGSEEVQDVFDVLILENRHPSFSPKLGHAGRPAARTEPYGHQDVFLFDSRHDGRLVDQRVTRIDLLLRCLGDRTMELYEDPRIETVFSFENSGPIFGPSIDHPHGQTFALPFTPKRLLPPGGSCPLCDEELQESVGLVDSRPTTLLLCPNHARLPYELLVVPRAHVGTLDDLDPETRADVAALIKQGLTALSRLTPEMPPYMLLLYQAPKPLLNNYHFRAEIVPINKPGGGLKYLGGLELGAGIFVNPSLPERSAATLRACLFG